jgi:glycerophosphoryl diester phosphodiesterase
MYKKYKITAFILVIALCLIYAWGKAINRDNNAASCDNPIKYIGHRGISDLAPENTLSAFELAGKLGFWGTECDVRTTSDGYWMLLHDDTVDIE